MFTQKFHKATAVIATTALFSLATIQSAVAAPGTLATAPLFLSAIVEPNVYFTIDDSGSMDWGPMMQNGIAGIATDNGLPIIDGDDRAYYAPSLARLYTSRGYLPPSFNDTDTIVINNNPNLATQGARVMAQMEVEMAEWDRSWVARLHLANLNYYNPSVTYRPWPGTKADGSPMYTDANPTAALLDPFDPTGPSVDLTASYSYTSEDFSIPGNDPSYSNNDYYIPTYVIWEDNIKIPYKANPLDAVLGGTRPPILDDVNGDGRVDSDDGAPAVPNGIIDIDDGRREVRIAAGTPQMQNFANWFQYHRSRINSTKSIIGNTINNTDASRMAMRLFNDGLLDDSGGNDIHVKTMNDPANKRTLLESFYRYNIPAQGTPMRNALRNTGNYFDDTGSTAPILSAALGGECQQNFNILMGDGFWNGGNPGVGNADVNGGAWNTPFDGNASQSNDGGNYADSWSDTLADVAMRDYERDLRGDLANKVPTQPGVDEADHQHLVTYAIAFGITGTLDPAVNDPLAAGFTWPDPDVGDGAPEKVDDMWHAAYNGRGLFLSAQNPDQLEDALNTAIADIAERTATAAAVSINSAKLTTQSVVYLAQFNTNRWQGDIQAFKIADPVTGALAATPDWKAQEELNNRNLVTDPRVILTYNGTSGTPFQWPNLTTTQRDDLKTSPTGGTDSDTVAQARLDYLRGDRSNEGTGEFFRERVSILGDIVHAGPVFVGAPDLNWPDKAPFPTAAGQRYSDFKNGAAKTRSGVVYTGSNYGMLHGFDELTGREVMAYVPNVLYSTSASEGMHYLTHPNYKHKYYVDLTPTLSDIYADLGNGNEWSTILVGGLRGGGRGIFALNVNDPAQFSETNAAKIALWEFTNAHDPDLGHSFSRPVIGMANNGRWVAVFGNGYNDTGSGEAKLFIVDIAGGLDGDWTDAGDVTEITTGSGNTTNRNGLSSPALADLDGDGTIDRVYAGDLFGQMWAFDLTNASASNWALADTSPLFTTIGNEPITSKPSLAKHPTISDTGSNKPNVMVFFGSGQYLTNADKTSTDANYFYGVWDKGDYGRNSGHLQQQTYQSGFTDPNGDPARVLTQNVVNYNGGQYGWYFNLPDSGERVVETSVVRGGLVFFNTFAPNSDPCSVGGYGFRMAVDIINGGSPDEASFDVNNDGYINDNDKATNSGVSAVVAGIRQEGYLPEPVFIEDIAYTAETPTKVVKLKDIPTGRFSWQELIQ